MLRAQLTVGREVGANILLGLMAVALAAVASTLIVVQPAEANLDSHLSARLDIRMLAEDSACPVWGRTKTMPYDTECHLVGHVRNYSNASLNYTVDAVDDSGVFDDSVFVPQFNMIGTTTPVAPSALADCPCTYALPAETTHNFTIKVRPRTKMLGSYLAQFRVREAKADDTFVLLEEYQLTVGTVKPQARPTKVTVVRTTDTEIELSWTNHLATDDPAPEPIKTVILWRPRASAGNPEAGQATLTSENTYTITGLTPYTRYDIGVQPTAPWKEISGRNFDLRTLQSTSTADYDTDDDGLIEVHSLQQLDAIRHDLDGDGDPDVYPPGCTPNPKWEIVDNTDPCSDYTDNERTVHYAAAYPSSMVGMGCPASGCIGYELAANLNFDTNGDNAHDSGDMFWNGGKGWLPLMGQSFTEGVSGSDFTNYPTNGFDAYRLARMFRATFEGNGRTISGLTINRPTQWYVGLFGFVGPGGLIRNVGLIGGSVRGDGAVGALAGMIRVAHVSGSYSSSVDVSGELAYIGGLIGRTWVGSVTESYATGNLTGNSLQQVGGLVGLASGSTVYATFATGSVAGNATEVGGLVGRLNSSTVIASHASGAVSGKGRSHSVIIGTDLTPQAGGLAGQLYNGPVGERALSFGAIRASYATGAVSGVDHDGTPSYSRVGGLCGDSTNTRQVVASYWLKTTSPVVYGTGCHDAEHWQGKTQTELQTPTGYTGIYSTWSQNANGDSVGSNQGPWDFGTASDYPILGYCADKPGIDLSWDSSRTKHCPLREAAQRGRTLGAQ